MQSSNNELFKEGDRVQVCPDQEGVRYGSGSVEDPVIEIVPGDKGTIKRDEEYDRRRGLLIDFDARSFSACYYTGRVGPITLPPCGQCESPIEEPSMKTDYLCARCRQYHG